MVSYLVFEGLIPMTDVQKFDPKKEIKKIVTISHFLDKTEDPLNVVCMERLSKRSGFLLKMPSLMFAV